MKEGRRSRWRSWCVSGTPLCCFVKLEALLGFHPGVEPNYTGARLIELLEVISVFVRLLEVGNWLLVQRGASFSGS